MMEYVHAHATYRFVISDEEDERARLLVSDVLAPSKSSTSDTGRLRYGCSSQTCDSPMLPRSSMSYPKTDLYVPPKSSSKFSDHPLISQTRKSESFGLHLITLDGR